MSDERSAASVRPGTRLAVDWGDVRIGVAACDPAGVLAYPVATIVQDTRGVEGALADLVALVREHRPIEVIFGLPLSLAGGEGTAAAKLRGVASLLARTLVDLSIPVRLVDERLSTVQASRALRGSGRSAKEQRSRIDRAAAVAILEHALDSERASGSPPGELVSAAVAKARVRKRGTVVRRDDEEGPAL